MHCKKREKKNIGLGQTKYLWPGRRIVFGCTRKGGCKSYLLSVAAGQGQIRP